KFDVICDFNANFAGMPMFLANFLNIPKRIVFYRQGSNHFKPGTVRNSVNRMMNRLVFNNATKILFNSKAALEFFFPFRNLLDHRFEVIYNGVNIQEYKILESKEAIRKQLNIPFDSFVIGHVGRFDKVKNHMTILKVFQQLLKEGLNCYLVLCGRDTEKLYPNINELGIEGKTLVLGYRNDIPRILKSLDCFLFPSITEGQPNALIEAMISGIPVVASDIPAIRECVSSQMVEFLCSPLDIEGLVKSVFKLANSGMYFRCPEEHLKKFDSGFNFGLFNRIIYEE
ncbi:MAG TPA: glycosyltransferase, partial [Saprospiraceae bacterium]|nr:glycosyltransferase [Saprospiraceae bacterium]